MKRTIILAALSLIASMANAINSINEPIVYHQPDGTTITVLLHGNEHHHYYTDTDGNVLVADSRGMLTAATPQQAQQARAPKGIAPAKTVSAFPKTGVQKSLVLLVQFPDKSLSYSAADFREMLNGTGYNYAGATGSAADYYIENSCGRFHPEFDVYGPVTMQYAMSHYGNDNDALAYEMVIEACNALDSEIDFTQYDRDCDGWVDNVYIFYAGYSEAEGGGVSAIWPHSSNLSSKGKTLRLDGVQIGSYGCSNELSGNTGKSLTGIGTFCHEFMHILGFPDLYATSSTSTSFTPGTWSIMDHGSYNNNCKTPPCLTAYEREFMGWLQPIEISDDARLRIPTIDSNTAYRINTTSADEYYLLENRQCAGWDTYLPGHGMLVWHIDYKKSVWDANTVNNDANHQYVDIVEADNMPTDTSRGGDTFPGNANVTSLSDNTTPSLISWINNPTGITLSQIAESAGAITLNAGAGGSLPQKPASPTVTAVSDNSIDIEWATAADADGYIINVYYLSEGRHRYVADYTNRRIDTVSTTISGLTPETTYYITVAATHGIALSEASEPATATTDQPGISYFAPTAVEATNVTFNSFTANWQALNGADGYLLSVFTQKQGSGIAETADFANKLELPDGWSTSCSSTFSVNGYYGAAAPSLRFQANAMKLQSPTFDNDITSLSLWIRGYKCDAANSLIVNGLINDKWTKIAEIASIDNNSGSTWTCPTEVLAGCRAIQLFYNCPTAIGSVLVDDVTIGLGNVIVDDYVVSNLPVGNTTSYTITDLDSNTLYRYFVTATAADRQSMTSNVVDVLTTPSGSVSTLSDSSCVYSDGNRIRIATLGSYAVYDIAGRGIAFGSGNATISLNKGIYIVRINEKSYKIIIQ